jgi:hypothetical protein
MAFTYKGALPDINFSENSNKKEYPADTEVQDSANYWFADERYAATPPGALLGPVDVVAVNVATKRGELKLAGPGTKVRAFIWKVCPFWLHISFAQHSVLGRCAPNPKAQFKSGW